MNFYNSHFAESQSPATSEGVFCWTSAVRLSDVKDGTIKTGLGEIMDATNEASLRLDVSIKARDNYPR